MAAKSTATWQSAVGQLTRSTLPVARGWSFPPWLPPTSIQSSRPSLSSSSSEYKLACDGFAAVGTGGAAPLVSSTDVGVMSASATAPLWAGGFAPVLYARYGPLPKFAPAAATRMYVHYGSPEEGFRRQTEERPHSTTSTFTCYLFYYSLCVSVS